MTRSPADKLHALAQLIIHLQRAADTLIFHQISRTGYMRRNYRIPDVIDASAS